jgi:3-hydroxyisobutyrate dehydrogenase-like beta-hydroxyacid dehydrogenase
MRVGFVGTGTMGAAMASCLIDAGHALSVYDIRPEATAGLQARGARPAASPRAAAQGSEVVFLSLPGPEAVGQAALDPASGVLAGLAAGGALIDTTTNAPDMARRLAEACRARGIDMLDAPVSGRPPGMTVMAGGEAAVFARYRPLLAAMAGHIFHVGPAGSGCIAKLVTQYLGYANFVAALEGMMIAAKAGIDLGVLAEIVPLSAGASRTFDNIPRAVLTGTFAAGGTLDIVAKDLALACALARAVGAPAALGLCAHDLFSRAQAQGWGGEGFPVVARILERFADCELRARPSARQTRFAAEDPRRGSPRR